jgi:hypothetical protein
MKAYLLQWKQKGLEPLINAETGQSFPKVDERHQLASRVKQITSRG